MRGARQLAQPCGARHRPVLPTDQRTVEPERVWSDRAARVEQLGAAVHLSAARAGYRLRHRDPRDIPVWPRHQRAHELTRLQLAAATGDRRICGYPLSILEAADHDLARGGVNADERPPVGGESARDHHGANALRTVIQPSEPELGHSGAAVGDPPERVHAGQAGGREGVPLCRCAARSRSRRRGDRNAAGCKRDHGRNAAPLSLTTLRITSAARPEAAPRG